MKKEIMKLNHAKIYSKEKQKIERKLFSLLDKDKPNSLYEPCRYILKSGGKRIRAILVLLSAKAVGAKYSKAYNAAAAVEILHNFTLVHDDIMDNANKRRGVQTLHVKYDLSTAILTGDNLIAVAYLNLLKDCPADSRNIFKSFTQGVIEVCEGQSLDKDFESRVNVSLDEYMIMIQKKTAALSEMCCSIGAQIGGGTVQQINKLKNYGRNLGIAFQLQDDLLDIIGDEDKFGKKVGGDLVEGKKTYLFLKALQKAKGQNKKLLKNVIKNGGIEQNQVKIYRDIYHELNIIEDTKNEVEKFTKRALNSAKQIEDFEAQEMLIWLANSLLNRNK
ncbi:MAG: polyprenyl synthetase family protein [Ignavibacteriae bacterium HGW-Ignavibacteriae-2]|nr:MAG: polyprenyl synthetase family protein [Ignavibacteriae bacterium HGW-Ignavibacteriae-2]